MSDVLGHRGGGHHHGGGGRGFRGGWGGYGYPAYPYPYPYDDVDEYFEVLVPVDADVLGAVDVGAWQRQINTLKQVPVSVARILAREAANVIEQAQRLGQNLKLPGDTTRNNVSWKIRWHAEQLGKLTDLNAMYSSGDDLKKWVLAAFVEANAVEEGATWVNTAWGRMWTEIATAIAALPVQLAKGVNETAGALFGMPGWLVGVAAIGILGTIGYLKWGSPERLVSALRKKANG